MSVEAMKAAADALHKIAASAHAKKTLAKARSMSEPLLREIEAKQLSNDEVQHIALNAFEQLVTAMKDAGVEGVTVLECNVDEATLRSGSAAPEGK